MTQNIIPYDDALEASIKYANENELAATKFLDKYALKDADLNLLEKTPDGMHWRMANEFERVEQRYPNPLTAVEIYKRFKNFERIIPQGSPMAGIGNDYHLMSLSNCFVVGNTEDSYGGIFQTDEMLAQLMKRRAGAGTDLSHIRPAGTPVKNAAKTSTGIIPFAERYSNTTREVGQGNRRGALMLTLHINHPDAKKFITSKLEKGKITGANISPRITDEFMTAVKNDTDFIHRFPIDNDPTKENINFEEVPYDELITGSYGYYRKVRAREIWETLINSAWESAEPGILFWDTIIREALPDCYGEEWETVSTNPSLRGDTLVLSNYGILPIKNLVYKEDLQVKNIFGMWADAKAFVSGHNKQLMKITFANKQEIYCTPEHKFPLYTKSGEEYKIIRSDGTIRKKQAKDIKQYDRIYYPLVEDPFYTKEYKFSKEEGFLLGWYFGDGWNSYHTANKSHQFGFSFNEDAVNSGIAENILEYTNQIAERSSDLRQDKDTKSHTYCTTDSNVISKLKEIGCQDKTLGIPSTIWVGNSQFAKSFIDGLFSSDGYIEIKDNIVHCRIVLVSSKEKLITDVQKLLNFFGISSNLKKSTTKNASFPNGKNYKKEYTRFDLTISGNNAKRFADVFTLTSNKNEQKLNQIRNKTYSRNMDYLSVTDVSYTDQYEDVYDITVFDSTNTFFVESGVTGNCGEIPLNYFDSCRLLALNLYSYVQNPFTSQAFFDWDSFKEDVHIAQRLMDDLVDLEIEKVEQILEKIQEDPEKTEVKQTEIYTWTKVLEKAKQGRRTGLGITAEGDMLAALNMTYGSDASINFAEDVHKTLKHVSYSTSVHLAKERGAFPIWDWEEEKDNPFLLRIKEENPELYENIAQHGRRNISNLTIAPTGTTSLMTQTTSGIENLFSVVHYRRTKVNENDADTRVDYVDEVGDAWQEHPVFHPKFKVWMDVHGYDISQVKEMSKEEIDNLIKKSPYYNATTQDVDWVKKVEMQGRIQKHVDHSISVTTNLPEDISKEKLEEVYMTAWEAGCKGQTIYRQGSRTGVLDTESKVEDFKESFPPKRPKKLESDIFRFQTNLEQWIMIVGKYNGKPYEIFTGKAEGFPELPQSVEKGSIVKNKNNGRSRYDLHYTYRNTQKVSEKINRVFDPIYWNYNKMISGLLRHGMPVQFIVDTLESMHFENDSIVSWGSGVRRYLKKYVEDGEKAVHIKELVCNCDSLNEANYIYKEACIVCTTCGFSGCE